MSKKICKECASFDGTCCQSGFAFPYAIECSDDHCEYFAEKPKLTIFETITQSPEVLTPLLVFHNRTCKGRIKFHSAVVGGEFDSREEALAATLARLKEVCNGN